MAIYKQKGNKHQAASYRPISITSVIIRIFEKLIKSRLTQALEPSVVQQAQHMSLISKQQCGFRKGFSTYNHLFGIINDMDTTLLKKSARIIVYLDIGKAYDTTYIDGLLYKLWRQHGINGHVWRWLYSFLYGRRIRCVNGPVKAEWHVLTAGVPHVTRFPFSHS